MRHTKHIYATIATVLLLISVKCTSYHDQSNAEEKAMKEDSIAHSQKGTPVTIEGTARNTKNAAVIVTDNGDVYYIDRRVPWDAALEEGKKISVFGELVETDYMEADIMDKDSLEKNGALKKQKLIIKPKYNSVASGPSAE